MENIESVKISLSREDIAVLDEVSGRVLAAIDS
jgi:hypothetical protein